jgi:hypothetical protein
MVQAATCGLMLRPKAATGGANNDQDIIFALLIFLFIAGDDKFIFSVPSVS